MHGHGVATALCSSHLFGHATTTLPHPCTLFRSCFLSYPLVRVGLSCRDVIEGTEPTGRHVGPQINYHIHGSCINCNFLSSPIKPSSAEVRTNV